MSKSLTAVGVGKDFGNIIIFESVRQKPFLGMNLNTDSNFQI